MSYIRLSTPVRKRKSDKCFSAISSAYAWTDSDGYVYITNGWSRTFEALLKSKEFDTKKEAKAFFDKQPHLIQAPQVLLTPAEMRYMCKEYLRQHGRPEKKRRTPRRRKSKN